jgi:hypothetical protein
MHIRCEVDEKKYIFLIGEISFLLAMIKRVDGSDNEAFLDSLTTGFEILLTTSLAPNFSKMIKEEFFVGDFAPQTREIVEYLFTSWGLAQSERLPFSDLKKSNIQEIINGVKYADQKFEELKLQLNLQGEA